MMRLPPGFDARPPRDGDVAAVAEVVTAAQLAARGHVDVTAADIAADWSRPSFDLASDAVVVVRAGAIVAYALQHGERAFVEVAPGAQGRGVGTALLGWTEAAARRRGAAAVGQTLSEDDVDARLLLARHGYEIRWETWVFRMPLDAHEDPGPAPPGVTVRALRRPHDDGAVYDVINTAFAEWPDREPAMTLDDWRAAYLDHVASDSGLVLVAEHDGGVVGAAVCAQLGSEGWVEQLAVARTHRGRGIARHLLTRAFGEFRRRGLRTAALSTESRTGARDLYEHVGLRVTHTYHRLSKPFRR